MDSLPSVNIEVDMPGWHLGIALQLVVSASDCNKGIFTARLKKTTFFNSMEMKIFCLSCLQMPVVCLCV